MKLSARARGTKKWESFFEIFADERRNFFRRRRRRVCESEGGPDERSEVPRVVTAGALRAVNDGVPLVCAVPNLANGIDGKPEPFSTASVLIISGRGDSLRTGNFRLLSDVFCGASVLYHYLCRNCSFREGKAGGEGQKRI